MVLDELTGDTWFASDRQQLRIRTKTIVLRRLCQVGGFDWVLFGKFGFVTWCQYFYRA
jgi:hypothetical protein